MSIKDKELLAFSNATNLDWQFANYIEKHDVSTGVITYHTLNTLLTPESFVRKKKKNEFEKYIYMDNSVKENEFNEEQKQNGLEEMQNSAGVLMNYLEECDKNSNEGNFLKDWEVVNIFTFFKKSKTKNIPLYFKL